MTVGELLATISAREITEWALYEQQHGPLGPRRGDYHAALVAAAVVNSMSGKKGSVRKLKDFLLQFGRGGRVTGDDEMERVGRQMAAMLGGAWSEGGGGGGDSR